MKIEAQGRKFWFQRASDIVRDGMGLELLEGEMPGGEVVAEVFFSDQSASFTVSLFAPDLPLEAVEALLAEAQRVLPPVPPGIQ